jgi:hypothetical protein
VLAGATVVVAGQSPALRAINVKDGVLAGTIAPGATAATPSQAAFAKTMPPVVPIDPAILAITGSFPAIPTVPLEPIVPVEEVLPASRSIPMLPVGADEEVSAQPHALEDLLTRLPMLVIVARDIAKGASVTLVRGTVEPAITPVSPLPNLVMMAPTTPLTPK